MLPLMALGEIPHLPFPDPGGARQSSAFLACGCIPPGSALPSPIHMALFPVPMCLLLLLWGCQPLGLGLVGNQLIILKTSKQEERIKC